VILSRIASWAKLSEILNLILPTILRTTLSRKVESTRLPQLLTSGELEVNLELETPIKEREEPALKELKLVEEILSIISSLS